MTKYSQNWAKLAKPSRKKRMRFVNRYKYFNPIAMYQRNVIVRLLTAAVFVLLIGATPHGNAEIPRRLEILFLGHNSKHHDSEKLADVRAKLAHNRLAKPLFDTRLFTRHIEAAYTAMYQRYQAGLPPECISVEQ